MKKMIIISLCFMSLLHAEKKQSVREISEWNAQDYANGNIIQQKTALWILEEANIDLVNKIVFDGGCRTGNISAIMAQKAKFVYGFDSHLNMIEWARSHYGNILNLSFEQCFEQDFSSSTQCDVLTLFFCLHWLKDKKAVFHRCYENLKVGGELIGNVRTIENGQSLSAKVFQEILPDQSTGRFYCTEAELRTMLLDVGFKKVSLEKKILNFSFKTIDEVIAFERPVVMSRPIMQSFSEEERESVFQLYMTKLLERLERAQEGYYINPAETTIIHCQK